MGKVYRFAVRRSSQPNSKRELHNLNSNNQMSLIVVQSANSKELIKIMNGRSVWPIGISISGQEPAYTFLTILTTASC